MSNELHMLGRKRCMT